MNLPAKQYKQLKNSNGFSRLLLILAMAALSAPFLRAAPAEQKISGMWDAVLVVKELEIPFRIEIAQDGGHVQGFFFDGDRKIGSTSGSFSDGKLTLDYDFLSSTLEAKLDGDTLTGNYHTKGSKGPGISFRAHRAGAALAGMANPPEVAGNWSMFHTSQDNSKLNVSWRLYLRQKGAEVSGAILKTSGDTGTLTGRWEGGKLTLSHFAGDRPLLFEAEQNPDGTLTITLNRQFKYIAARTAEASSKGIPDPPDTSKFTSAKDPNERFHFNFPDLDGKPVSDSDPRFHDKVVILTIGGTWCPNCHDEAPSMEELYKEYHARGLEVVGSFETDDDLTAAKPGVLAFMKRYGITFTMLVPGTPDQISEKLPQLVNLAVYPTTVILGRDGRVRKVHVGFASVATGEEHKRLIKEMHTTIEELLSEKPASTPAG